MPQTSRYALCVVAGLLLYTAAVYADYYRRMHLPGADFTVGLGVPFAFWIQGGFAGLRILMPGALVADIGIAIAIALVIGWTWGHATANFRGGQAVLETRAG
jgi:hypothetical protein